MQINEILFCYMNRKIQGMIIGMGAVLIILLSVGAQIQIQAESVDVFNTDVIVLQVGFDKNVQLAVDTFIKCFPNKENVLIKNINSKSELFFNLDDLLGISSHVIFGHGTQDGLIFPNREILAWNILKYHIETIFESVDNYDFIPVMACYSGTTGKHYGGWRLQLDATYAGILASELICNERDITFNSESLFSIGRIKQLLMENPLFTELPRFRGAGFILKWVANGPAAFTEAEQDRFEAGGATYQDGLDYRVATGIGWTYKNIWPGSRQKYDEDNPHIVDWWFYSQEPQFFIFYISSDEDWTEGAPKSGRYPIDILIGTSILIFIKMYDETRKDISKTIESLIDGILTLSITFWETLVIEINNAIAFFQQNPQITATILMSIVVFTVIGLYSASGGCAVGGIFTAGFTWKEAILFGALAVIGTGWILSGDAGDFIESVAGAYPSDSSSATTTDSDNDHLPLLIEEVIGTSDSDSDTDDDGLSDLYEYKFGFNPLDPNDPTQIFLVDTIRYGADEITLSAHGLKLIDKLEVERDEILQGSKNVSVSLRDDFDVEINDDTHEILMIYYAQNNTAGTEWVEVGSQEFVIFDAEALGETPEDHDTDGVYDLIEIEYGTNPYSMDTDGDGLTDDEELFIFGTDPNDDGDSDDDGINDEDEACAVSHFPNTNYISEWDTDEDSIPNWFDFDSDGDGLNDTYEDTNANGVYDSGVDVSNFLDNDTDDDGLTDGQEVALYYTDPKDADTDDDGLADGWELENHFNPLVNEADDWALYFGDDFSFNLMYNWEDVSIYGSMRAGGLATTTVYNNAEANEDFVVRIFNSSDGDWSLDSSANPQITQYQSSSQFYGFVVTWDLSDLRSSDPAEAVESATIDLKCHSYSDWDSTDDINIAFVNLHCNGSILNDSSTTAHVNYSMWSGLWYDTDDELFAVENIDVTAGGITTDIDIVELIDIWYQYTNNSMFSLFFYPDPENTIEDSSESITFCQGGSDDPCITVVTGDSIVHAESYGSADTGQIRGPMIVHDFGCAIDDFNLSFDPYIAEETNKMGYLYISLWSGDNATGNRVFTIRWYDSWYDGRNKFQLFEADYNSKLYELDTYSANKYEDWTTPGEDNCTLIREDDAVKLYTNGELIYNSGSGRNTTDVRSLSIECLKKHGYSVISKEGMRSVFFQGHSDDYDDDGLDSELEESSNTNIWISDDEIDTDGDLYSDATEILLGTDFDDDEDIPFYVDDYVNVGSYYAEVWVLGSPFIGKVEFCAYCYSGWISDTTYTTSKNGYNCFYLYLGSLSDFVYYEFKIYNKNLNLVHYGLMYENGEYELY